MKVIGLTGGIASGKSTAASIIRNMNIPIIDADKVAREIVEKGQPALKEIQNVFGKEIINEDGSLNRKKLGNIVFSDPKKLDLLNNITHPRIFNKIHRTLEIYREEKMHFLVVLDHPLLIEMNMSKLVDEIWLVAVEMPIQIERLMVRDQLSREDAKKRIDAQMSLEEKKKFADIIIYNQFDLSFLELEIKRQIERISYQNHGGI